MCSRSACLPLSLQRTMHPPSDGHNFFSPSNFLHACLNVWEFFSWRMKSLFTPEEYIPTPLLLDEEGRRSVSHRVCLVSSGV